MKSSLLRVLFIPFICIALSACSSNNDHSNNGYVETDLIYVSSPVAGRLDTVNIHKGEAVTKNQQLYRLEQSPQRFELQEASADFAKAQADLRDLRYGQRQPELNQIQAKIKHAEAELTYANMQLKRYQRLVKAGAAQQETLDSAQEQAQIAQSNLFQAQSELITAKLPARKDQIEAAAFAVQNAAAALANRKWQLNQKTVQSPIAGRVFDLYYRTGEQVPADRPVLSIITAQHTKIVFFVNARELSQLKIGQKVRISNDGVKSTQSAVAKIDYLSNQAEYTPPVLYTQKQSAKLVFRIEARFINAKALNQFHPGAPVTVHFDNVS